MICDYCRRRPQQADFTVCKPCHDASHREDDLPQRYGALYMVLATHKTAADVRGYGTGVVLRASQDLAERYPGLTVQRALWMLAADEGYGTCGHCGRLARLDDRHRCEGNHLVMLSSSAPEDVAALLLYRDTPRMKAPHDLPTPALPPHPAGPAGRTPRQAGGMSAEALIQQALSDHRTAAEAYEDAIAATYGPAGAESALVYARSQYRHGQDAATRALRLLRSHQRAAHIMRRVVIDLLDADSQAGKPYLRDAISRARRAHNLLTDSPSGPPQKETGHMDALKLLNRTTGGAFALDGDQIKGRLPEDGDRSGELYPIWLEADDCRELAEALETIAKHLETTE